MKNINIDDLIDYLQELIDKEWSPKVNKTKLRQIQTILRKVIKRLL